MFTGSGTVLMPSVNGLLVLGLGQQLRIEIVGVDYLTLLPCQMVFVDTVFDLNHAQAMPWLILYNMYGSAFFTQRERFIS